MLAANAKIGETSHSDSALGYNIILPGIEGDIHQPGNFRRWIAEGNTFL